MLKVMYEDLIIPTSTDIAITVVRTAIILIYTFLLLRLVGKKQVSQFTWFDILLIVALGSAVGDTMIYPERTIPILISMTAIFIVIIMVKAISYLMIKIPRVEDMLEGSEFLLIDNGKILQDDLKKADLTERELLSLLRQKGHHDLSKINQVYLEVDGGISVVKKKKAST